MIVGVRVGGEESPMKPERAWFLDRRERRAKAEWELIFLAGENQRAPNLQPLPISRNLGCFQFFIDRFSKKIII
jgi:hypothetical protein